MYKTQYGPFNGDSWESFCQQCFKKKYENDGYQEMPAWQGDLGIEGFTRTGVLFQCYCPDMEYPPDKLYVEQRDKITKDLGKLQVYQKELISYLKDIKVHKWIFVTPGYQNKDIVRHCHAKAIEYRALKIPFLAEDFDVLIYDIDFFSSEIPLVLNFRNEKLAIIPEVKLSADDITDWKSQKISLVDNALKKNRQRFPAGVNKIDEKVNKLTQSSISYFLDGDILIRKWKEMYPDQYETFVRVVTTYEKRVEDKCTINNGDNNQLYNEIEQELKTTLKNTFAFLDEPMIENLTSHVMADWILRCPISFE